MVMTAELSEVEAARSYEDLFVPSLFAQWAPKVADAARIGPGQRVLDIACGTGVLAREMARRTGPAGFVAGVDANAGMLELASRLDPSIEWHHGLAESLPFPSGRFDAAVSQFGLMLFTDRLAALREMRRVVAHGGRAAVAVWSVLDDSPGYAAEVELLERTAGRDAADALRAPFVLGDRTALVALFEKAGFHAIDVHTEAGEASFPSIRAMVEADLRGWLPVMGVHLDDALIAHILREAETSLARYRTGDGRARARTTAHIVAART